MEYSLPSNSVMIFSIIAFAAVAAGVLFYVAAAPNRTLAQCLAAKQVKLYYVDDPTFVPDAEQVYYLTQNKSLEDKQLFYSNIAVNCKKSTNPFCRALYATPTWVFNSSSAFLGVMPEKDLKAKTGC